MTLPSRSLHSLPPFSSHLPLPSPPFSGAILCVRWSHIVSRFMTPRLLGFQGNLHPSFVSDAPRYNWLLASNTEVSDEMLLEREPAAVHRMGWVAWLRLLAVERTYTLRSLTSRRIHPIWAFSPSRCIALNPPTILQAQPEKRRIPSSAKCPCRNRVRGHCAVPWPRSGRRRPDCLAFLNIQRSVAAGD